MKTVYSVERVYSLATVWRYHGGRVYGEDECLLLSYMLYFIIFQPSWYLTIWYFFFLILWEFCLHVCLQMCAALVVVSRGQTICSWVYRCCEPQSWCWELKSSSLEKQSYLLSHLLCPLSPRSPQFQKNCVLWKVSIQGSQYQEHRQGTNALINQSDVNSYTHIYQRLKYWNIITETVNLNHKIWSNDTLCSSKQNTSKETLWSKRKLQNLSGT